MIIKSGGRDVVHSYARVGVIDNRIPVHEHTSVADFLAGRSLRVDKQVADSRWFTTEHFTPTNQDQAPTASVLNQEKHTKGNDGCSTGHTIQDANL